MLGADLKYLASAAALAQADPDPRSGRLLLSTSYTTGAVTAQYASLYSLATCWVERDGGVPAELEVCVEALRFSELAALFDAKEDVTIKPQGAGLRLSSKRHNVKLGTLGGDDSVRDLTDELESYATISASELAEEIKLAADYTAKSLAKPVLTGVRLQCVKGELRVMAFNGFSLVFAGRVKGEERESSTSFVVPAKDTLAVVGLFRGGSVSVLANEARTVAALRGDDAWVRLGLYFDHEWPDLSPLMQQHERQSVTIPSDRLGAALAAIKALDSDPYLEVSGDGGRVLLKSAPAETGQYVTVLEGEGLVGSWWYDAENVSRAAKIGDEVTFEIASEAKVPTMVRGKGRRVWMSSRVRPV